MNKFETAEQLGRDIFTDYVNTLTDCKILKYSKDKYATWDVSYLLNGVRVIGEIKVREKYHSEAYNGWIYEEGKHNELKKLQLQMEVKLQEKIKIHYINIHPLDNKIKVYDVTDIEVRQTPTAMYLPKTTMGNQNNKMKMKYEVTKNDLVILN